MYGSACCPPEKCRLFMGANVEERGAVYRLEDVVIKVANDVRGMGFLIS